MTTGLAPALLAPGRTRWTPPAPGECHVWRIPVLPRAGWIILLDAEEQRRARQFPAVRGSALDVFVTSRAVQRLIGSAYLGIEPSAVTVDRTCQYCAGQHGRPRWPGTAIEYSVSHTDRWLMLAVSLDGPVGLDLESDASLRGADEVANTVLTAAERVRFADVPAADKRAWLLTAWTRKEAAMKLTGLGLAASPRELDVGGPVVSAGDVPNWPRSTIHLHGLSAPDGHAAALASTVSLTGVRMFQVPA